MPSHRTQLASLVLSLILCLALALPAGAETIEILTGEWAPYTGKELPGGGVANEIVMQSFLIMGEDPVFVYKPWKRIEKEIMEGTALCSSAWGSHEYRKGWSVYSESFIASSSVAFYLRRELPNYDFTGYDDLKQYRVGGIGSYYYEEQFKKHGIKMDLSHDLPSLIRKLKLGRIDIFLEDELVGWTMIREVYPNAIHEFDSSTTPATTLPLRLMCSKAHADSERVLEVFAKGLKKIKENGELDRIMAPYN